MFSESIVVWLYLALCILLGFIGIPKMRTLKDYAVGNGQFSTTVLAISMMAACIDSFDTIGNAEKGFSMGATFIGAGILQFARWYIIGSLLAPALPSLKSQGCMTLVDIMGSFYGKLGRYVGTATLLFALVLLSIYYKSAAFILERYLHMDFKYAAAIVTSVIALYCIFGGVHAIVVTDVVQFFIFAICFPVIFIWGILNMDVSAALDALPYEKTHITSEDLPTFLSLCVHTILPILGLPYIQRLLMCEKPSQIRLICNATGVFDCAFLLMLSFIGLVVFGLNPEIKSDEALFFFIDHSVPTPIIGVIAVAFLAVIMSTASSFLNSLNIIIVKDIINPLLPIVKEKNLELLATKIVGVVVVFISFNLIYIKEHIIDTLWMMDNFYDPFVTIPFIMALLGIRIKAEHYKYVIINSTIALLIARYFHDDFDTITFTAGVFTSLATIILLRDKKIQKFQTSIIQNGVTNNEKLTEKTI